MDKRRIHYRDGYKYQLAEPLEVQTPIQIPEPVGNTYLLLSATGILTIMPGWAWDGPSGPTYDSLNTIRPSAVHDALYELIRTELLDPYWRQTADELLYTLLIEDGMSTARAWIWYQGVHWGAGPAARPSAGHEVKVAP